MIEILTFIVYILLTLLGAYFAIRIITFKYERKIDNKSVEDFPIDNNDFLIDPSQPEPEEPYERCSYTPCGACKFQYECEHNRTSGRV